MSVTRGLASLAAVVLLAAGCTGAGAANDTTLTVLAASSLTDAFTRAGRAYEKAHPGVTVRFSFAGSQHLAGQVRQGLPADVIATADQPTMRGISGHVDRPRTFARNRLVIAVAAGNPRGIDGLHDLARDRLTFVLAAPAVPAGHYARRAIESAGVQVRPDSLEPSVRAVLTRVRLGEADAGIVYATDAQAASRDVAVVRIPAEHNQRVRYPAAALTDSEHPRAAHAFVEWLRSPRAGAILREYGFETP